MPAKPGKTAERAEAEPLVTAEQLPQRSADDMLAEANARLLAALTESEMRATELSVSNRGLSLTIEQLRKEIERRRKAEAELSEAKELAERANRAKSFYLATASHDLRQPLHSMRLLLAVMPRSTLPKSSSEIVDELENAVETIGRLLNALLDVSKLEAGSVSPSFETFSASELLDRLERNNAPLIREKRVDCRFVACSEVVRSDPDLLSQILQNFLSNALRHCRDGRVLVGCRRSVDQLSFQVWDQGEGIPEAELALIFNEFYQVGNPQRDRERGLGLGLSIADRLGRLLGHSIGVRSWPDRGTVFTIEVPLAEARKLRPKKRQSAKASARARTIRHDVLVVEDNRQVLQATTQALRAWGFRTQSARTGLQAIRALRSRTFRPRLVIADYHLPRVTGIAVLKEIRRQLGYAVPGLIITGHLSPNIIAETERLDCLILQKPVAPDQLRRLSSELAPLGRQRQLSAKTARRRR
jgi:signal transduction histidine kinase